jgi:CDP-glycerol glycerophosphotransferase (TagB/SpsB family)
MFHADHRLFQCIVGCLLSWQTDTYQFDLDKYNETNGSYIDMEKDLFGERCLTREELLPKIHEYYENGFKEKTAYAEMRKKYLAYHDHNNRRRTYEFIKDQGY